MHSFIAAALVAAAQGALAAAEHSGSPPSPGEAVEQQKLEEEIAKELGAAPPEGPAAAPTAAPGAPTTAGGEQGATGGNPFARLMLLPDISAIGSAALAWNRLDVESLSPRSDPFAPAHTLHPIFQELELGLQAVVDPYARADVFLTFGPKGAGVEEAYLTTLQLPAGLQARAGELYAPFGRQNQQHAHTWEFVDRPLALARLLAVDGLRGAGLDAAWLAPTPWFAELHLAYQELTPAFGERSRHGGVARLAQFFDVGEASTLGVGLSAARLEADAGHRDVVGADLYLKIRAARSRSYLAFQGELLARRLDAEQAASGSAASVEPAGTAWGGYAQAVVRDGAYFAYGVRYERAAALGGGPEHRGSLLASWLPSEFQRLRVQVSYDRLPNGVDGLEALLHLEFAIGAHGAHPF